MRGHIRQRGKKWYIVISLGKDEDGKRKQKWFSGYNSQGEAEDDLPYKLLDAQDGLYMNNSDISLKNYLLNVWLVAIQPDIRLKTYKFYKYNVEHAIIPVIGNIRLSKLKPLDVKRMINHYLKEGTVSHTTIRHYYRTLSVALNKAVQWEIINKNPCKRIKPPAVDTPEMKILTARQVNTLLEYTIHSKFKVMYIPILLAAGCGLRRGEILGLKWENIDFQDHIMHVRHNLQYIDREFILADPKTKKSKRDIPLPDPIVSILQEHKSGQEAIKARLGIKGFDKKNAFVCSWKDGANIIPDYLDKTLNKILKQCKLPHVRFHDLRHTYAALMLGSGVRIKELSDLLGHSKTSVTMDIYAHSMPSSKKEAVEKMGNIFFLKNLKKAE